MRNALSMLLCLAVLLATALPVGAAKAYTPTVAIVNGAHYAVKSDGTLWSWGTNIYGELGDGTTTRRDTPKKILDDVVSVSGYNYRAMAVRSDGSLWAWGNNDNGILTLSQSTRSVTTPVKIMDNVKKTTHNMYGTMILKTDNTLWGMGMKPYTYGSDGSRWYTPTKFMDDVKDMALASNTLLVVKNDGSLWSWGWKIGYDYNEVVKTVDSKTVQEQGFVAALDKYFYKTPTKIMDGVKVVEAQMFSAAVIKNDNTLWTWGQNRYGQVGNGTTKDCPKPFQLMDNVSGVTVGSYSSYAIKKDGTLWGWGSLKSTENTTSPIKIMDGVAQVVPGPLVLKKDGSLVMWDVWTDTTKAIW